MKAPAFNKSERRLHRAAQELKKRNEFIEDNSDFDSFSGSEGGRCEDHSF